MGSLEDGYSETETRDMNNGSQIRSMYLVSRDEEIERVLSERGIAVVSREYLDDAQTIARKMRACDMVWFIDPDMASESEITIASLVVADRHVVLSGNKCSTSTVEWSPIRRSASDVLDTILVEDEEVA